MDVSQIVVSSVPALVQYVLTPATIFLLLFLVFIYWRSGSSHVLLLKTWLTVFGQPSITSRTIQKFASDELDLTHFRYLSGIKVSTLSKAERLINWSLERDIGLRLAKRAGRYFDFEKPGPDQSLFLLSRRHVLWRVIPLAVLIFAVSGVLGLLQYDRAIIQVRSTGTHFSVDRRYASLLMGSGEFYFKDCGSATKSESIDEANVKVLCDLSKETKIEEKLTKTVSEQRWLTVTVAVELMLPLMSLFWSVVRIYSAIELRKKLKSYDEAQREVKIEDITNPTTPELSLELPIRPELE